MVEISASVLSVNKEDILPVIYNLEFAKIDYFHIDVMDGKFVQDDTTDRMQKYCENIKQISNLPLDIHLMVNDVKKYIDLFIPFNPNIITFHIEACKDKEEVLSIIKYIKDNNVKVGIAIKPNTRIDEIMNYIPFVHMILVMTVEPGRGGQNLIPKTIKKVKELSEYLEENNYNIDIETDGGINLENKEELINAGSNILVCGNTIINSNDYIEIVQKLKK